MYKYWRNNAYCRSSNMRYSTIVIENWDYKSLQIKVYLRSFLLSFHFTSTWVFHELHSIPTTWLTLFMVWTDYVVFNLVNNMDHNSLDHDETWILNALDHLNEKNPLHLLPPSIWPSLFYNGTETQHKTWNCIFIFIILMICMSP